MADVITRFKVETAEYDRKIGQSKTKLKEFEKSGTDAGKALNDFAGKMGMSIPKLGAMGAAVGAVSAALAIAKDAFSQSESAIDEWGRMTSGAKGAYDMFLQSLNTGNWDNFLTRLNDAITGARDLYDALDRLGSIKANNQAAIAITQQSIQQLRLRQQNGEDVTSELTAATERLAKLQRQEVEAGITAGTDQMVQTLKNAGISEAMARQAADEIAKGGQDVFDKYAQMVKDLEKEGTGKGKAVSKLGGIIKYYQEGTFDEANLNEEQKKMYQLAKAITERETTLQQGIATYAQAVQQGTASAREQFKNTKYGSSGSGGGGSKKVTEEAIAGTIADYQNQITALNKTILNATDQEARESALRMVERYTNEIKRMKGETSSISSLAMPDKPTISGIDMSNLQIDPKGLENAQKFWAEYAESVEIANEKNREAVISIHQVATALQSIDDPMAKVMGILMEAVMTVAESFAAALSKEAKGGVWNWIAAAVTGTATMISTIQSIKSATRFANGGIVPGNNFSGDNINGSVMVNSGELILNRAQQGAIASQLQQGANKRQEVEFRIGSNELVGVLRQAENIKSFR